MFYYASLYFSTNNRFFLTVTGAYATLLWWTLKQAPLAFFLVFIATLPFTKGRAYEIVLLPWDKIRTWALYPIVYFLPLYLSDAFLFLTFYGYVRRRIVGFVSVLLPRWPLLFFTAFILWSLLGSVVSPFPEVGIFSGIQLVRLFLIMCLPSLLFRNDRSFLGSVYSVLAASLLFESFWAIAQWFHGGPLGRDVEVYLPRQQFGIGSSENSTLLRVTGTFFEPSILGTFLLMQLSILSQHLLHTRMRLLLRIATWLLLAAGSVALVFTGSRVLYGLWIVLAVFLLWPNRRRLVRDVARVVKKYRVISLGIVALTAAGVVPYVLVRLSSLSNVFTQYGTASYRIQMMLHALQLARARPLIGGGLSQSPYYYATAFVGEKLTFDPTYPHNILFQLLVETGIVGALLFVLFVGSIARFALRDRFLSGFALAAATFLVCAMFYPLFINQQEIVSYFFVAIGLYFATLKQSGHG